jgi:hypothetical protein
VTSAGRIANGKGGSWTKRVALDDHEEVDGEHVLHLLAGARPRLQAAQSGHLSQLGQSDCAIVTRAHWRRLHDQPDRPTACIEELGGGTGDRSGPTSNEALWANGFDTWISRRFTLQANLETSAAKPTASASKRGKARLCHE